MSAQSDILNELPIDQLAEAIGATREETEAAANSVIPALLGGMEANIQHPGGQEALLGALGEHVDSDVNPQAVDTADGEKIAAHVFGGQQDQVISQLGGLPGANNDIVRKLIPILAPIVISYLSKRVLGQASNQAGGTSSADILTQILSGVLGANAHPTQGPTGQAAPQQAPQASGPNWGDILGGLLGGGTKN